MRVGALAAPAAVVAACSLGRGGLGTSGDDASEPDGHASADATTEVGGDDDATAPDAADAVPGDAPKEPAEGGSEGGVVMPGGPSLCGMHPFLFCDGFENGPGMWTPDNLGAGTEAVDKVQVFRGQWAAHATTPAINNSSKPDVRAFYGHTGQGWPMKVWVRVFAWFSSPYAADRGHFVHMQQEMMPYGGVRFALKPGKPWLAAETYNLPPNMDTAWPAMPDDPVEVAAWHCYEFSIDATTGDFSAWVDDQPIADLSAKVGMLPVLTNLAVGVAFTAAGQQGQYDAWIDEVVLDKAYVPCAY